MMDDNFDNMDKQLYKHQRAYYEKNKDEIRFQVKKRRKKIIADKTYYCEEHNKSFYDSTALRKHLNSRSHKTKRKKKAVCPFGWCDYTTPVKQRMTTHLLTLKHRHLKPDNDEVIWV